MKSNPLLFFTIVGYLHFISISLVSSQSTFTTKVFYTSCQNGLIFGLPNLSFVKREATFQSSLPCNSQNTNPTTATITWYYYTDLPTGSTCVAHNTVTSIISFTTVVYENVGNLVIGTATGTVTAGQFFGQPATRVTTLTGLNADACASPLGVQARSGTEVLTIGLPLTGPTCNGVLTQEICPGLKN